MIAGCSPRFENIAAPDKEHGNTGTVSCREPDLAVAERSGIKWRLAFRPEPRLASPGRIAIDLNRLCERLSFEEQLIFVDRATGKANRIPFVDRQFAERFAKKIEDGDLRFDFSGVGNKDSIFGHRQVLDWNVRCRNYIHELRFQAISQTEPDNSGIWRIAVRRPPEFGHPS